jgi:hypothetical protein
MSRANPRFRRANNPLPVPTNNLYQANVLYTQFSQQFITTLYYLDNKAVGVGVDSGGAASAVLAALPAFQSVLSVNATITGVTARSLTTPTALSSTKLLLIPLLGTVAGQSEGSIMAATIDRQTAIRGQAGRGHVNLGPVPSSFTSADGSSLNGAGSVAYAAWSVAMMGTVLSFGGTNYTPALASRGLRTQTPKILGAAPLINSVIRGLLGTTRRRKIGRGK